MNNAGLRKNLKFVENRFPLSDSNFHIYFREKLIKPLLKFLQQGITPKRLALTVALGIIIGLFPFLGSTTIICTIVAVIFRLNLAVINIVNFFVYPLQLVLFIPFIKLGQYFFSVNPMPCNLEQITHMVKNNTLLAFEKLWFANLIGIAAWGVLALPIFLAFYFTSLFFFKKMISSEDTQLPIDY